MDMEIIVGESIVLPCQVASDPVLDVSFSWAFNGQLIANGDGHFELVGGVSDPQSDFLGTCEWAVGTLSHLASLPPRRWLKVTAWCFDLMVLLGEVLGVFLWPGST